MARVIQTLSNTGKNELLISYRMSKHEMLFNLPKLQTLSNTGKNYCSLDIQGNVKNRHITKCANSILLLTSANSIKFHISYASNNHSITLENAY